MAVDKTPVWRHQITMVDREELTVDGVTALGSYDEKEIMMETEQGAMQVKGEGLNIKQLNLEQGNIVIEGLVKGIQYDEAQQQRRGLLNRFLK